MPIKINAAARLKIAIEAGWFDALSDVAKKAYMKLHPNSKMGKSGSTNSGGADAAKEALDKAKAAYDKLNDKMKAKGGNGTDAEWAALDAAEDRVHKARKAYQKAGGTKG